MSRAPIGVFDSGVGGLSVLAALRSELPAEDFVYFSDAHHAPYGERDDGFVIERTLGIARQLVDQHAIKALVVACNTATAAGIELLRAAHPDLPVVGVEPALKPAAAATRTGHVGVLATRGTLGSRKFKALHNGLQAGGVRFSLMPCDGLAGAIERADDAAVQSLAQQYVGNLGRFGKQPGEIDIMVLGCTHYPFIAAELQQLVGPEIRLIETGQPVAQQTRRLLAGRGQLAGAGAAGSLQLLTRGVPAALQQTATGWLQPQAIA